MDFDIWDVPLFVFHSYGVQSDVDPEHQSSLKLERVAMNHRRKRISEKNSWEEVAKSMKESKEIMHTYAAKYNQDAKLGKCGKVPILHIKFCDYLFSSQPNNCKDVRNAGLSNGRWFSNDLENSFCEICRGDY